MATKKMHNGHSPEQIAQKSRWMFMGMTASALQLCRQMLKTTGYYSTRNFHVRYHLGMAAEHLYQAFRELKQERKEK